PAGNVFCSPEGRVRDISVMVVGIILSTNAQTKTSTLTRSICLHNKVWQKLPLPSLATPRYP
ncbi:MAG: hypothetical protein NT087_06715, partial [Deltaproteobacteria bacterium]|nr:hypothetical protein [Deltaproteobacteria bacterium]